MSTWAVVLAAGSGSRFADPDGVPKALRPVAGVAMYLRSVRLFDEHPGIDGTVLVFPAIWEAQILEDVGDGGVAGPLRLIAGGETRGASVRAGLSEVPGDADVILVHDAARPLADHALVDRVLAGLAAAPACIPAVAVTDTVKRRADGVVGETLDRDELVAVQTPQAFRAQVIRDAHEHAAANGIDATDDAALVEARGVTVAIAEGDRRNIKITTQQDLVIAEVLLVGEVSDR